MRQRNYDVELAGETLEPHIYPSAWTKGFAVAKTLHRRVGAHASALPPSTRSLLAREMVDGIHTDVLNTEWMKQMITGVSLAIGSQVV